MFETVVLAPVAIGIAALAAYAWRRSRAAKSMPHASPREKDEALFVAMFPELQPHFHPEKVLAYVKARRGRTPPRSGFTWQAAPGFGGLAVDIRFVNDREECALVDAAGGVISTFRYESLPSGGVMRLGRGKITVDLSEARNEAVRYWHPEREFKWSRKGGWRFRTPVAEQAFASPSTDSDSSATDSSSSGRTTASAPFAGRGGTFDGGGASGGWEAGSKAAPSPSPGASAAGVAAVIGASALAAGAVPDRSPRDSGGDTREPTSHGAGGDVSDGAMDDASRDAADDAMGGSSGEASGSATEDSGGGSSDGASDDSGGGASDTAY